MRSDMPLMSVIYRGIEAMRETYVNDVMAVFAALHREAENLWVLAAADVNLVEVAMRVRWLSMGSCGESHETTHLM